jgi:hypothetical protein
MCRIDPETIADVCSWNNTNLEYDIKENKELQYRYKELRKEAWEYVKASVKNEEIYI